ncbi:MAG: type 1 periplasmic-binding domain-containing protein [Acidimicrobiales bacterium]
MQTTPAMIGRRYSPLLALGLIQILLVVVAPSVPGGGGTSNLASGPSAGGLSANGAGNTSGSGTQAGSQVTSGSGGTQGGGGSTGGGGGGGTSGGGGGGASTGAGGTSGGGGAGGGGGGSGGGGGTGDRSHCDAAGLQWGPTFYKPPCASWQGGDNGGATMTGVSSTTIKYVFYRAQANPAVNAILGQEGLAATDDQACQAYQAFHAEVNKRWEFYGRKLVSLDGPGNNAGSAVGSCKFPFFQGQCSLTPPDPPCERAEADVIAAMKPAYVMAPVADPAFYNQLSKDHIVVSGGENQPDSYHQDDAPYYYDAFMSGTRAMTMLAEFYCKELVGKPPVFAGADVLHPNGVGTVAKRKLAIIYPQTNGDPTQTLSANLFIKLVTGGMCGSPSDGVKGYPYASDITQAETQSTTTVSGLKAANVTTPVFFGDPIAPVFLTNTADQQNYHPEWLQSGTGLVDYDVLAQLYNKNEWLHAFGPSTLADNIPFDQSDAVKAWHDVGRTGLPDKTENLAWTYFFGMGNALQVAGPALTPLSIRDGLFNTPPLGGDHLHALQEYGRPNDYTGLRDARIVWYCPTATSPINNQAGSYVSINGGQRYQVGQIPSGNPTVFPHGLCGA